MNIQFYKVNIVTFIAFLSLSFTTQTVLKSQNSDINCNDYIPIVDSTFSSPNLTVNKSKFTNESNIKDDNLDNYASWNPPIFFSGSAWIEIKDNNATGTELYQAGSYVGFIMEATGLLGALSSITISTYEGGTFQESVSGGSILSIPLLGDKAQLGFTTTKNFDRVRLTVDAGLISLDFYRVYHAEILKHCAGPTPECNTNTYINRTSYPADTSQANTGFGGLLNLGSITNHTNAIDEDTDNYASLSLNLGLVATGSFSIKVKKDNFLAGAFAGMDIENSALLGANLLGNTTITTYLDGQEQEALTGGNLISVPSTLLAGTGRQTIGFLTTKDFDEIKFSISQTVSLDLGTTRIYGAVVKKFCSAEPISCNRLAYAVNKDYPTYINGANTGFPAGISACVGCELNNSENVVDDDTTNYASISLGAANALQTVNLSVAHGADDSYGPEIFVGFEIATNPLLDANVIAGSAKINLYNNGSLVHSSSSNSLLLGATTSLLEDGLAKQPIGIVVPSSVTEFDEMQLSFEQVANLTLGPIRVYNSIVTNPCNILLLCKDQFIPRLNSSPIYINSERTGASGLVGALGGVSDAWNLVDSDTTNHATISVDAQVVGDVSIAAVTPSTTFPKGTYAGFVIEPTFTLVELDLFNAITITTFNDGIQQESSTGNNLLNLDLLGILNIGTGNKVYNVGILTTLPFDEIQLSVGSIVNVNLLQETYVYSTFFDFRNAVDENGDKICSEYALQQDFNSGHINTTISGNVSINDTLKTSSSELQYSSIHIPGGITNPSTDIPTLNPDGTYSFNTSTAGTYFFEIEIEECNMVNCEILPEKTMLQITVLEDSGTTPPVINPDYGVGKVNTSITINSLENDYPTILSAELDPSSATITEQTKNGVAVLDPLTGNITYTPNTNFVGRDTLTYEVCDNSNPAMCESSWQVYEVQPDNIDNTTFGVNDYLYLTEYKEYTGNLLINDYDLEGDNQQATAKTEVVPDVGTLEVNANGNYTFTPDINFTGSYTFTYEVCDDNPVQVECKQVPFVVDGGELLVKLNLRVKLQGALVDLNDASIYNTEMRDEIRAKGLLPTIQPYNFPPYNYAGTEEVTDTTIFDDHGSNSIVDWILIEIRDINDPTIILQQIPCLLQVDGDVVNTDGKDIFINPGEFYFAIRHRIHLGVMTAATKLTNVNGMLIDFTTESLYEVPGAAEGPSFIVNGEQVLWGGDVNQNGQIRFKSTDNDVNSIRSEVLNHPGNIFGGDSYAFDAYLKEDVNMNGEVRFKSARNDVNLIRENILVNSDGNIFNGDGYNNFLDNLPR